MKLPKLNLTASGDQLRPVMCHIFINENEIVSTNAHVLIKHDRELLNCVENLPEKCYIHSNNWIEFTKEFETARFVESENIILLIDKNKKKRVIDVVNFSEHNYPNYNAVIPDGSRVIAVEQIGLNPQYLLDLKNAATINKDAVCKFTFNGFDRAVNVDFYLNQEKIKGVSGLIMPNVVDLK